jgi:hypothetical protein
VASPTVDDGHPLRKRQVVKRAPPEVAPYGPASPLVRRLAANSIALGDGWRGSARPLRALCWAATLVPITKLLAIAELLTCH